MIVDERDTNALGMSVTNCKTPPNVYNSKFLQTRVELPGDYYYAYYHHQFFY